MEALEAETVAWGLIVITGGLMIRLVVSYLAVFGAGLDHKERMFVAVAWLPKATAQAAIGSLALDQARRMFKEQGSDQDDMVGLKNIELGMKMQTLPVLTILIAAPLGSMLIMSTGPRFLKTSTKVEQAC